MARKDELFAWAATLEAEADQIDALLPVPNNAIYSGTRRNAAGTLRAAARALDAVVPIGPLPKPQGETP